VPTLLTCDVGNRLYIGTGNGNLSVYSVVGPAGTYHTQLAGWRILIARADGKAYAVTHLETKKNLTRKAIDQLGYVKDINSLVVLSRASFVIFFPIPFDTLQESQVTLFDLPELSGPTPLPKAKSAFSFAVHTSVQHLYPDGKKTRPQGVEFSPPIIPVPSAITYLVVGCQRKLVVYSWKDGEAQDIKVRQQVHFTRSS
jgi:hypothetical protein